MNMGPLLYHFSDMPNEKSIEPSYEDLEIILKVVGFEILENQRNVPTKYTQNPRSMYQTEYSSGFLVCRKPEKVDTSPNLNATIEEELISN